MGGQLVMPACEQPVALPRAEQQAAFLSCELPAAPTRTSGGLATPCSCAAGQGVVLQLKAGLVAQAQQPCSV